jgi:hypothetical protein
MWARTAISIRKIEGWSERVSKTLMHKTAKRLQSSIVDV